VCLDYESLAGLGLPLAGLECLAWFVGGLV